MDFFNIPIINNYGNTPIIDYELLYSTNYLVEYYKRTAEFNFLILTTYHAIQHPNVFYPRFLNNKPQIINLDSFVFKTDLEFIEAYDIITYKFIVMSLYTAKVLFNKKIIVNLIDCNQFEIVSSNDSNDEYIYLFHGSFIYNWYSILRNNILVANSQNKLMVNGAAHGPGIYMSNDANMSLYYSKSKKREDIILGVYRVSVSYANEYIKTGKIYVFPDNSMLHLKYFFQFKSYHKDLFSTIAKILNEYFSEKKNDTMLNAIALKRLTAEYKKTSQMFSTTIVNDNILVWHVDLVITNDDNASLYNELTLHNIHSIRLEILFSTKYPFSPPFIRILSPRFEQFSGHITLGGSICTELLTNTGWVAAMSIENVIIQIKSLIIEGKGKLHKDWFIPYTLSEAQSGFSRMKETHGWV